MTDEQFARKLEERYPEKLQKPYFAKYLPVEGEIKEGDMVLKPTFTWYSIDNSPIHEPPYLETVGIGEEEDFPKFKLHKLFLCSRDIQVGDRTNYRGFKGYTSSPTQPNGIWDFYDENNDLHHIYQQDLLELFKVIGEISPEATWVTENMEFDKEDVKFCIMHDDFHVSTEDTYEEAYNHGYYEAHFALCRLVCLIKGPCEHFH